VTGFCPATRFCVKISLVKKTVKVLLVLIIAIALVSSFVYFKIRQTPKLPVRATSTSSTLSSADDWAANSSVTNIDLASSPGSFEIDNKETSAAEGGSFSHNSCVSAPEAQPENIVDGVPTYPSVGPPATIDYVCDPSNWIEWDFTDSKLISRVRILSAEIDTDPTIYAKYSFRYWNGSTWVEFLSGPNQGGAVWETHDITPEITTDKIRIYHDGETGPGDDELLEIREVQILSNATGTLATGATQIDGGENFWSWEGFTPTDSEPANTSIDYRYRTSTDGADWTAWTADFGSVTSRTGDDSDSPDLYRYLQVEATLANTDGVSTPTIEQYDIGYHTEVKPSKPTAQTAVAQ